MRENNEHRPIDGFVVEYVMRCNILELLGSAEKGLDARTQLTGEMARDLSFEWTNYTNRRTLENDIPRIEKRFHLGKPKLNEKAAKILHLGE